MQLATITVFRILYFASINHYDMQRNSAFFIHLAMCGLCFLFINSCHKTVIETSAIIVGKYSATATLNGANEPEPIVSDAAGSLTGHFDESTNTLSFSLNWSQLSSVVQSIELQGSSGESLAITGFSYSRNGSLISAVSLPADALNDLLNGGYFINIKTSTHPAGEIRGVVLVK